MYGIVNKAIEGLVVENFGQEKWEQIKAFSKVREERFLSNEQYDDSITFNLAIAASEVLKQPIKSILIAFGKYWVLKTARKHYGSLMDTGGNNLRDFVVNLPNFHSRVMLLYPNIKPPEFKITHLTEKSLRIHYYSTRRGLTDFVEGLLLGLGEAFNTEVKVEPIYNRSQDENDHDAFNLSW